jgi:hypothetical protein
MLLALGTPGSDESGDALKSCPGHVGSQLAQISVAPWPGLINPVLSCCKVRCFKRHKRHEICLAGNLYSSVPFLYQ